MARATLKLDDLAARRGAPAPAPVPANGDDTRRGQTLRLRPAAWAQLKILAVEQGKPSHELLIEAVNLLFDRYGKPTIAG
jgi:hypothetical protein